MKRIALIRLIAMVILLLTFTLRNGVCATQSSNKIQVLDFQSQMISHLAASNALAIFVNADKLRSTNLVAYADQLEMENTLLRLTTDEIGANAAPWEMFAKQLRSQIQGADSWQGLQLVSTPLAADWNDPKYGNYRAWHVLSDQLPAWGGNYRSTQRLITKGYQSFIGNIAIPLPDEKDRGRAEDAQKTFMSAVDLMQKATEDAGDHWLAFNERQSSLPSDRRLSYDEWYSQFDGRKIAAMQSQVDLAGQEYTKWLVEAFRGYGFVANIVNDFANPAFQKIAESPDGREQPYRTCNITPDLGKFIDDSRQISSNASPKLSFTFDKSTAWSHQEDSHWSGSLSFWPGFWGISAGASGSRTTPDTQNSNFKMEFSARNIQIFSIVPGDWFNGEAIQAFKNGPWLPNGPVATHQFELWGPDGILNLMPSAVLVAYQPKVVARLSASDYHSLKTSFQSSGGFSIGPFGFGASYGKTTSDIHLDDASNTITAADTTDVPQIIAVISSVLPDFK